MSSVRQQILETAGQLFGARGYELVGINEIIEKSGVAKATFYAQFKSKENLCTEWLRAEAMASESGNQALLASNEPAIAKVEKKFVGLKKYVKSTDFRGCPFSITASMLCAGTEVRDVICQYKTAARDFWHELARQVRPGSATSRALGDSLFLLYSGAITEAQNVRSTWPLESAKVTALSLCQVAPGT